MLPETVERKRANQTKFNEEYFITKVNEIFFDAEAEALLQMELVGFGQPDDERWRRVARKHFTKDSPVTLLDIGTGAGYVACSVAPFLKREDTIICSDISSVMLQACQKLVAKKQFECQFRFVKLRGEQISEIGGPVDFITMSAVLHHIPNLDEFCSAMETVLSEGGILVMAEEPNEPFYTHWFLWNNYVVLSAVLSRLSKLRATASSMLAKLGLLGFVRSLLGHKSIPRGPWIANVVNNANMRLLEEGLIKEPLTGDEIQSIYDIHLPTAKGSHHKERGFDIHELMKSKFANFELVHFETYKHCWGVTYRNAFTRMLDNLLGKLFPEKGAMFLAVLKKK